MSNRREFPRAVRVAVIKRAGASGMILCEGCGGFAKRFQIDHRRPDGLLGEPTLENAQLLGECCHGPKNAADATAIAHAKRREANHLGVKSAPSFHSRGFARHDREPKRLTKTCAGETSLARRIVTTGETE